MAKKRKKTGRKPKGIREREVLNLAKCGCTTAEIAAMLNCCATTIEKRFRGALKRGRNMARAALRVAQYRLALDGCPTMQIWLGKQLLGQTNTPIYVQAEIEAAPSMIAMAAAMDASIPIRPPDNGNGFERTNDESSGL